MTRLSSKQTQNYAANPLQKSKAVIAIPALSNLISMSDLNVEKGGSFENTGVMDENEIADWVQTLQPKLYMNALQEKHFAKPIRNNTAATFTYM